MTAFQNILYSYVKSSRIVAPFIKTIGIGMNSDISVPDLTKAALFPGRVGYLRSVRRQLFKKNLWFILDSTWFKQPSIFVKASP